jgi:hypothetical protein
MYSRPDGSPQREARGCHVGLSRPLEDRIRLERSLAKVRRSFTNVRERRGRSRSFGHHCDVGAQAPPRHARSRAWSFSNNLRKTVCQQSSRSC